eukprot:4703210-Pyramimonas_sp.AAC.1
MTTEGPDVGSPPISLDALLAGSVDAFDIDFGSKFDVDDSTRLVEQDDINEFSARPARLVAELQAEAEELFQSVADTVNNANEAHRAQVTRLPDKKRMTNDGQASAGAPGAAAAGGAR